MTRNTEPLQVISLRLSEADLAKIDRFADAAGLSRSEWIRQASTKTLKDGRARGAATPSIPAELPDRTPAAGSGTPAVLTNAIGGPQTVVPRGVSFTPAFRPVPKPTKAEKPKGRGLRG